MPVFFLSSTLPCLLLFARFFLLSSSRNATDKDRRPGASNNKVTILPTRPLGWSNNWSRRHSNSLGGKYYAAATKIRIAVGHLFLQVSATPLARMPSKKLRSEVSLGVSVSGLAGRRWICPQAVCVYFLFPLLLSPSCMYAQAH